MEGTDPKVERTEEYTKMTQNPKLQGFVLMESSFQVPCYILGTTSAYGHTRYKVSPVGGSGHAIVDATRVSHIKETLGA